MITLDIPPGEFAGYIFDCDGTLADTMGLHYQAWVAALTPYGCDFPEELFYSLGGMPAVAVIEFLNERNGLSVPPVETALHKESLYEELIPQVRAIEPVVDFVYKVAGKAPLAVGSGGLRHIVIATLEALGLREYFQAVVASEDVVHGKPAPDTYLEAARRLGVDPARCLVFEDTPLGISAATAAGMQSVLVASGLVIARAK
jgi:beta-phosphoglucomutase family hydrolase